MFGRQICTPYTGICSLPAGRTWQCFFSEWHRGLTGQPKKMVMALGREKPDAAESADVISDLLHYMLALIDSKSGSFWKSEV